MQNPHRSHFHPSWNHSLTSLYHSPSSTTRTLNIQIYTSLYDTENVAFKLWKEQQHEDAEWIWHLHQRRRHHHHHHHCGSEIHGFGMPLLLFGDETDEETEEARAHTATEKCESTRFVPMPLRSVELFLELWFHWMWQLNGWRLLQVLRFLFQVRGNSKNNFFMPRSSSTIWELPLTATINLFTFLFFLSQTLFPMITMGIVGI